MFNIYIYIYIYVIHGTFKQDQITILASRLLNFFFFLKKKAKKYAKIRVKISVHKKAAQNAPKIRIKRKIWNHSRFMTDVCSTH